MALKADAVTRELRSLGRYVALNVETGDYVRTEDRSLVLTTKAGRVYEITSIGWVDPGALSFDGTVDGRAGSLTVDYDAIESIGWIEKPGARTSVRRSLVA